MSEKTWWCRSEMHLTCRDRAPGLGGGCGCRCHETDGTRAVLITDAKVGDEVVAPRWVAGKVVEMDVIQSVISVKKSNGKLVKRELKEPYVRVAVEEG